MENIIYFLNYFDVYGVNHVLNIYKPNYVGGATQVDGEVILTYAETKDVLECIRGNGLSISLQANTLDDFSDLYTEDERTYRVEYLRDGINKFNGFLDVEGLYEDYVTDTWFITLDCIDGLGYLSNLSFVDTNGLNIVGIKTGLDIITACLLRTGLSLNINTNIDIYYSGLTETLDILDNAALNCDRYVKDDEATIMNCDEVLRSVLEPYGACITQRNGEWYIYKPNTLFNNAEATFFRYGSDGVALAPATQTINLAVELGSNINNFYPHYANANQSFRRDASLGAYRVNYKYGLVKAFFTNTLLISVGGVIDQWTINSTSRLTIPASEQGVEFELAPDNSGVLNLTSDNINLLTGDLISYEYKFQLIADDSDAQPKRKESRIRIVLNGTLNDYYLTNDGEWIMTVAQEIIQPLPLDLGQLNIYKGQANPLPEDGNIRVEVYTPRYSEPQGIDTATVLLSYFSVTPRLTGNEENVKGEIHTIQRTNYFTSKIENVKEIFNGDNGTDTYLGAIYKNDLTTPTTQWKRKGVTELKPLLRIMVEEKIRLQSQAARLFTGDIYGYVDYLSVITLNGISGVFMPIKLSYDTAKNITSLELKQIYNDTLISADYTLTLDRGNVVKPTIKG